MKSLKKSFCLLLAVVFSLSCFSVLAFAEDGTISVALTVEGTKATLYDSSVSLMENATVYDLLNESGLSVTFVSSEYGEYLTAIEGEYAGSFYGVDGCKGWDGWLYTVNGAEGSSVQTQTLSDGDKVLFYYGDPYGVGMQYPELDFDLVSGVVTITSQDSAGWGEPVETKPVVGATFTFGGQEFITDENGQVKLPAKLCKAGTYTFLVEKYSEHGLPLVLRTHGQYKNNLSIVQVIINFFKIVLEAVQNLFKR